jgi:hypothetical protein
MFRRGSLAGLISHTGERSLASESKHSSLLSCLNKVREGGRQPVVEEEETGAVWDSTQTLGY